MNWKKEAAVWRKTADRLAAAVKHYRGPDWQHGGAKSHALSVYNRLVKNRAK